MSFKVNPKVRAALDRIDEILAGKGDLALDFNETALVAAVISAVRGPDDRDDDLKYNTACVVRKIGFPLSGDRFGTVAPEKKVITLEREMPDPDGYDEEVFTHFESHILSAAEALAIPILYTKG